MPALSGFQCQPSAFLFCQFFKGYSGQYYLRLRFELQFLYESQLFYLRKMSLSELKKDFFDIGLALISGILLILCFCPAANLAYLAWFAFLPLFFCLQNKSKSKAFIFSYLCGVVFWLGAVYWLVHVTFIGLILLVLYLALYFGVFGLIISGRSLTAAGYWLFFIPSVWVLLEYLRSHLFTGFGWALLGYSQYLNLPAIQIANITGIWGVSFLVMMVNISIYRIADSGERQPGFINKF